jgi:8-oxo-dGTP pyrophosphatase MutT (NUDIX family)
MTIQEKIDILSLKFDILWYRMWVQFPTNIPAGDPYDIENWRTACKTLNTHGYKLPLDLYISKKNKYESTFIADGGKRLAALLKNTKNNELMWEIPKGRRNSHETQLDCAIREFEEETGVGISSYCIMFDIKPITIKYISDGTMYIHNYYTTYASKPFEISDNFEINPRLAEVGGIKWMCLDEIKYTDATGRLYNLVNRVFTVFKSKYKYVKPPVLRIDKN